MALAAREVGDGVPEDRFLHPRLGASKKVSALTDFEARVWAHGYILCADDYGVMPLRPAIVRGFNRALERSTDEQILAALRRVVDLGLLLRFEHQGDEYVCDPNWQDFQKVRYPSSTHYPVPPSDVLDRCSEATVALFARRIPRLDGYRSAQEVDVEDALVAALPTLMRYPQDKVVLIRQCRIEASYLDVVVEVADGPVFVIEVKRQRITRTAIEQLDRYVALARTKWPGRDVVPVLVGFGLVPSLLPADLQSRGILAIVYGNTLECRVISREEPGYFPAMFSLTDGEITLDSQDANSDRLMAMANGSGLEASSEGGTGGEEPSTGARAWVEVLNDVAHRTFRLTEANLRPVRARIKDGFTLDDARRVVAAKVREWGADERMSQYLRPITLFGSKFESYLEAAKGVESGEAGSRGGGIAGRWRDKANPGDIRL